MFQNVVIGKPLVDPKELLGEFNERDTLFTEERWLPAVLVEAGVAPSRSEVQRNKPELCRSLDELDCIWVKWGKKRLFIIVGQ